MSLGKLADPRSIRAGHRRAWHEDFFAAWMLRRTMTAANPLIMLHRVSHDASRHAHTRAL